MEEKAMEKNGEKWMVRYTVVNSMRNANSTANT